MRRMLMLLLTVTVCGCATFETVARPTSEKPRNKAIADAWHDDVVVGMHGAAAVILAPISLALLPIVVPWHLLTREDGAESKPTTSQSDEPPAMPTM